MEGPIVVGAYAVHMGATALWIGGLAFLVFYLPASLSSLPESERAAVVDAARLRFGPYAWMSVALFVGTGLIQMSVSPRYQGLLAVGNVWGAAILVKHLLVAAMVALLAYQTWVVHPFLERVRLGWRPPSAQLTASRRRLAGRLEGVSLALGGAVLLLTAVARAAA